MNSTLLRFLSMLLILAATRSGSFAQCGVAVGAGNRSPVYNVVGCLGSPNLHLSTGAFSFTHQWQYKASVSGTYADIIGATNPDYQPGATGIYRAYVSNAWCSGYTDSVVITVGTSIPVTVQPEALNICPGSSVKLSIPGMLGSYVYEWFNGAWSVSYDSLYMANMAGTYYCVVTDLMTNCTGTTPAVTLTSVRPPAPAVVSPLSYCRKTVAPPLTAAGSGLIWYNVAIGGSAYVNPPVPSTTTAGFDTFYVSQSLGTCESPRSQIAVEVMQLPAQPTVSSLLSYCHNAPASVLTATGNNLQWYLNDTGGVASQTAPTPVTTIVGNDTFYVTQTGGSCESERAPIIVQTRALPNAPVPALFNAYLCPGDTLQLAATGAVPRGRIDWTGPGALSDTGVSIRRALFSFADTGHYHVRVTDTFGCASFPDSLRVVVDCPDPVWPGDVNQDHTVDHFDALSLALSIGSGGPARVGPTMLWQPELCASWSQRIPSLPLVNRKHADCDGNGSVNIGDTMAISVNYGQTHPRGIRPPAAKATGAPGLHFDLTGVRAVEGRTILVPVMFGSGASPVAGITGIAASVAIEGVVPSSTLQLAFSGSWLNGPAMLKFGRHRGNGSLDWVYARTDGSQQTGGGHFATLEIRIPNGTAGTMMKLHLDDVLVLDATGTTFLDYQVLGDSILIESAVGVKTVRPGTADFSIAPNPSSGNCVASVRLMKPGSFSIEILDLSGRLIRSIAGDSDGRNGLRLPLQVADLGAGVYMIQLRDASGIASQPQKWIRL